MCLSATACALEPAGDLAGPFEVVRIVDGDTVELEGLGSVRLIGIDTPEKYDSDKLERKARETGRSREAIQSMGRAASTFAETLLEGRRVWLELGVEERDRFGRVLGYVYVEDPAGEWDYANQRFTQVNLAIVDEGWAEPLTIPPNVTYADFFVEAAQEARAAGRGMWAELVVTEQTVEIACILYDPAGEDAGREVVTLYAIETTDVTDWRLTDDDGEGLVLEGVLEAGYEYDFDFEASVWGNGGDTALLYDPSGRLADELSYAGGGEQICR